MNEIKAVVDLIRWRVDLLDLNNLIDSYTLVIPNHVNNANVIGDLLRPFFKDVKIVESDSQKSVFLIKTPNSIGFYHNKLFISLIKILSQEENLFVQFTQPDRYHRITSTTITLECWEYPQIMDSPEQTSMVYQNGQDSIIFRADKALELLDKALFEWVESNKEFNRRKFFARYMKRPVIESSSLEDETEDDFEYNPDVTDHLSEKDFHGYEKYGGYNGFSDDDIDIAFDGNPEATWNVD